MEHTYTFESFLNESTEVSVEKITTPAERKALKNAFENIVTGIDKLSFKKDGTIEGKRGYFYRHGITPEKTAKELTSALKKDDSSKVKQLADIFYKEYQSGNGTNDEAASKLDKDIDNEIQKREKQYKEEYKEYGQDWTETDSHRLKNEVRFLVLLFELS